MEHTVIDSQLLRDMFTNGYKELFNQKDYVNDLNVFPVPDGDTGTNMTMTIMSAAKEVNALSNPTMAEVAKAISSGSLRGARGNSGVILSKLLRTGFGRSCWQADMVEITGGLRRIMERAVILKPLLTEKSYAKRAEDKKKYAFIVKNKRTI